jgi:hypothetical protein
MFGRGWELIPSIPGIRRHSFNSITTIVKESDVWNAPLAISTFPHRCEKSSKISTLMRVFFLQKEKK